MDKEFAKMYRNQIFIAMMVSLVLLVYQPIDFIILAQAHDLTQLEERKKQLNNEKQHIEAKIKETLNEINALGQHKESLQARSNEIQQTTIELTNSIKNQKEKIQKLTSKIKKGRENIKGLKVAYLKRKSHLHDQIQSIQGSHVHQSMIYSLLEAESAGDLIHRLRTISAIINAQENQIKKLVSDQELLESSQKELEDAYKACLETLENLQATQNKLSTQSSDLREEMDENNQQYENKEEELAILKKQQEGLVDELQQAERAIQLEEKMLQQDKSDQPKKKTTNPNHTNITQEKNILGTWQWQRDEDEKVTETNHPNHSEWKKPCHGYVTSNFGPRYHPIYKIQTFHAGIDFGGGGPIFASRDGTVKITSYHSGLGYYIKIDHGDGFSSVYGHMQADSKVQPDQKVTQGQVIGTMGSTGTSTGIHLHFEIHKDGRPVDPSDYIKLTKHDTLI